MKEDVKPENRSRPDPEIRVWTDPKSGTLCHVRICPRERPGCLGVHPKVNTLVFETAVGGWVGWVAVYHRVHLWSLDNRDLAELLEQAVDRG